MALPSLHVRFLTGARRGHTAVFRRSPVRAGRSRDNDILVPELHEPLSSGRHAEFLFDEGHWWVVDLDSTNGTRLNGTPVRRARLRDRDRLSFGDHEFQIRIGPGRLAGPLAIGAIAAAVLAALAWYGWQATRGPLDRIAASARRSVYLLVIQDGDRRTPVGTAFAIDRSGRLATNAHVAAPLEALLPGQDGRIPFAVSADARVPPRRITGVTLHPGWQAGSVSNDVALVTVEGPAGHPLPLADDERVAALQPGATVAIFGFPAAFTEPDRPHGSLAVNVLREIRGSRYLLVGVAVAPGSSGSPVFTADGEVVAMIAGSGREEPARDPSPAVAVGIGALREMIR